MAGPVSLKQQQWKRDSQDSQHVSASPVNNDIVQLESQKNSGR